MRTTILFLVTVVVLVAGAVTVVASPQFNATTTTRPSASPLLVSEQPPPTPTPTPAPTPTPTPPPATGVVTFNVPVYKQLRNLDCETAALQMALAAMGIDYTQNQLIAMQPPPDTRTPVMGTVSGHKAVLQWGDPYKNFVGNIDGADLIPTGYGIYYPPLLSLIQTHGLPNAEGGEGAANGWTASRIYAELAAGHPVMAWTETGWGHPYVGYWTSFDEKIQIRYSLIEHVVTLSGVSSTQVRVNDPWHSGSQYWFSKAEFERSWADFDNMAIVLK
jgi:uncharacterized protein YvpB